MMSPGVLFAVYRKNGGKGSGKKPLEQREKIAGERGLKTLVFSRPNGEGRRKRRPASRGTRTKPKGEKCDHPPFIRPKEGGGGGRKAGLCDCIFSVGEVNNPRGKERRRRFA